MADKAEKAEKSEATAEAAKTNRGVDLTKFNTLSIVSIATAATGFGAVAGIITGHVSLSQIKRTGERGTGLALAGVILGYVYLAVGFGSMIIGAALRIRGIEYGQGQMRDHMLGNMHPNMHGGFGMGQDDGPNQGFGMGQDDGPGNMGQIVPPVQPGQPGAPVPIPGATN